ncbi:hypothetical protein FA10DRAFT_24034 [Acaromyces ingoldii]|uniref:Uncharacterized protein n=1 Tax=Acaromyces ingoldii TaxID=215250 RepID=A0A316YXX3_9BASI|nr:hypothetical protein FA10DRAFT_24034 [Acaromyces ingoldii]PWN93478.1 hypothetical protein FA10DRAFT_24034 [Acaromyces ingoldii]
MHVLSLSDGGALRHWVTSIINARTYVLKQERAALFALDPPAPKTSVAEAKEAAHPLPRTSIEASQYPPSQQQPQQQNAKQQMQVPQRKATVTTSSVAAVHEPIASSAPQTLIPRNAFAGPFEKGSLLASEAMKQPQLPPPSSLPQNQQQLGSWDNAAPIDLRVHERTRQRLMAEQRRQELLEVERARRRAREPLIQGIAMPAQHQQPIQPQAQGQPQAQTHQYRSRTSQQQPYQRR